MAVYREVTLDWEGAEYTFTPSFKVIQRIDRALMKSGTTITSINAALTQGMLPMSDVSELLKLVMDECGLVRSLEDWHQDVTYEGDAAIPLYLTIAGALLPSPKADPKKQDAPAQPDKAPEAKK